MDIEETMFTGFFFKSGIQLKNYACNAFLG